MPSKRCSTCNVYWPTHHERCPDCGGQVWRSSTTQPITKEEYDERMALVRYRRGEAPAPDPVLVAQFERDWAEAERRACVSGFDVADIIVAQRKPGLA